MSTNGDRPVLEALRAAGIDADLHVLEAAPHGFFGGSTPEDQALDTQVGRFIDTYCPPALSGSPHEGLPRDHDQ